MEFLPYISTCYHEVLVEPTKDSMLHGHRITFPKRRVFDGATVGFDYLGAAAL